MQNLGGKQSVLWAIGKWSMARTYSLKQKSFLRTFENRQFAQFFVAVALKKTVVTTAQLLQFVAHSSTDKFDPVYRSKNKNQADSRLSHPETEGRVRRIFKSECTEKSSKIGKSWPQLKT